MAQEPERTFVEFEEAKVEALAWGERAALFEGASRPLSPRAGRGGPPARPAGSGGTPLPSREFEQSGRALAAADAHRHHHVLDAAPLPLDQRVAGEARAAHAVRVADRDRAAVDVELVVVDTELVAAVDHLHGEGLVELPEADVVHLEAVGLEELRNGEHRPDAHLVWIAAGDRDAAIDPERRQVALARELRLHQHAGARAVGKLRGVAGGNVSAGLDALPVGEHGLQRREAGKRRVGPVSLVLFQGHFLVRDGAGRLVGDFHDRRQRNDLGLESPGGLRRCGALLRLQREFVLRLARDLVALGDDFGGLDHRHVRVVAVRDEPRILIAITVRVLVLDERDRLEAAAYRYAHAVDDDLLGGDGDRHQARGALAVDRHAGDAGWKTRSQRRLL